MQNQTWFPGSARDAFTLMIDGKRLLMGIANEDDYCVCGMVEDRGGRCICGGSYYY
jgi:hypothetical protein